MASADFDGDGIPDLVVGYRTSAGFVVSLRRGNLDAFAPTSDASFQAIGRGEFPAPFLPASTTAKLPASPDLLATGHFTDVGNLDLVVAAKGGKTLYLLAGDGKGGFAAPKAIAVDAAVTALAAGAFPGANGFDTLLVAATDSGNNASLLRYSGTQLGLASVAKAALPAAASQIAFGSHYDGLDAAVLAGGRLLVLHAADMRLEDAALPVSAAAMALGHFIYDRDPRMQVALLGFDGSVQIAAHDGFDPRVLTVAEMQSIRSALRRGEPNPVVPKRASTPIGWKIVEAIPGAASFPAGQAPLFFRTRISDHGADDVMILDPSTARMKVIAHPDSAPGSASFQHAQISTRAYAGTPVAAAALRVNIDGRPGVVALHAGESSPVVMMPLPDPIFFVNRTDDPTPTSPITNACNNVSSLDNSSSCSIREAVLRANVTAGTDTISVPSGTFTLTLAKVANDFTGNHGALYINDSVNIMGAGQASTIIQAGTSNATGVDMVMAVNEDINPVTDATASIANLTLKFGHNRGVHGNDGDGGCMEFDTGSSGTANLALTNVTLDSCSTTQGNGGGIAIFNFVVNGPGQPTLSNVIVQNNSASDSTSGVAATAGGIWVSEPARMSMSNSQVLNNSATEDTGAVAGEGGGITVTNRSTVGSRQTVIQNSMISGNHAAGNGGGIHDGSNLSITLTSITNNLAGTANRANAQDGGGLFLNTSDNGCPGACTDTVNLQKVTITGNTTTLRGGGIALGNNSGAGSLTMNFSRLAGNTAPNGSNLSNNSATATVTNNWWGTNTPSTTISTINTGSTTSDPFIVLAHTASPSTIRVNQSTTLTADMSKDNHGSALGTANLNVLIGLPIAFGNAVDGSISGASATLNSNAQATATFNAGAAAGGGKADATVDQQAVTADIVVLAPLQIAKTFNPVTVPVNGSSTLTFAVNNPNVVAVDGSFTDSLPAGLVVAATPGVTNTCGGTVTATAGSGSITFSNAAVAVGSCSIGVDVSSAVDNTYNNSVTINSTAAGTDAGSTSSASLTVINPPAIVKSFGAATLPLNGTTTLTMSLSSSNVNLTLAGVAFTDSLPAGLVVAPVPNLNDTCGGTATATAGSGTVSLSGASLAPAGACTVSVDVQGTTDGVKNNSVTVTSTNAGTGNTSNASITVAGPPVLLKAFGAASIPLNGSTSLSFTVQNNNATAALSGVAFSDTLPAGLVVATPNGLTGSCGGGTITATQGTNAVSLAGATLAASSSCTFSVNVTGVSAGLQNNTSGNVTSTEGGTGGTASASLNVVAPPSIAKAFNPAAIALNATTSLTFTITNPAANAVSLTGVAFTDTLPTGLTVANATATVCGGTLTTTAPTGIALSGATIAAAGQCQFSVTVTGAAAGNYTNTTGNVTSTNGGTGNTGAANLSVAVPPSIAKAFGAASIPLNGTTSLTFNITNPNTTQSLTGLAFTDSLPAGIVVAPAPGVSDTCGGSVTAAAGAGSVSLASGTLAANASCTVVVNIQGTSAGVKNNSVTVSSAQSGAGNTSNATITVAAPPVLLKAFGAAAIPLNGSTSLSFTVQNNNATVALTGIAFTDTMPTGLVVATPNGLTGSCGGGTITATQGTNAVSLAGATLAASASCTFSVNVTGTTSGAKNNTTGNVSSTEGGTGGTASASIGVEGPPVIAAAFVPAAIAVNGVSTLTLTISNAANASALTGVAVTDNLPAGVVVATPNGLVNTCAGTATATAGSGSVSLTGGIVAAGGSCTVSANVTASATGSFVNTTGVVSSTNGGTGNTGTATLTVQPADLTIAKTHSGSFTPGQTGALYTITVSNGGAGPTSGTVTVVDTLPAIPNTLVPTAIGGTGWSCTLGTLTCTRSDALAPAASYPAITLTVDVPGNIQSSFTNTATVSGGGETNTANDTASDPTNVVLTSFTGPTATGTGTATVSFSGGGPACTFAPQGTGTLQSAFFIPVTGSPKSPALPPPAGVTFPQGLLDFVLLGCNGSPITFTVTYPAAIPLGFVYWKFGPTADNPSSHWYQLPVTLAGSSVTFTLTDGGLGDDDLTVNGTIVDQGGPGTPGNAAALPVPALDERALVLLALLVLAFGIQRSVRRRGGRG